MKIKPNWFRIVAMAIALVASTTAAPAQTVQAPEAASTPQEIATRLLDHLDAGRYDAAQAMFDEQMRAAVPASALHKIWSALPVATGREQTQVNVQGAITTVKQVLLRGETRWIAQAAISSDGRIAGFRIVPAEKSAPVPPPPANAPYRETETRIGQDDRALPATVWMPKAAGPVPGVVLVHGSGPQDRYQTIGPNSIFLDIARGLATQGIAVLSYDKRSKARPQDYDDTNLTIDSETTDDAVAAIAHLQATHGVDPKRVFVLGHSQGAMLAPRIVQRSRDPAGMILFAAPSRKLLDILIEQNIRMAVLDDGKTSPQEAAAIAKLKAQVQAARGQDDVKAADLPLGLPIGYWRSVDAVDPVAEAVKTKVPILIVQGARDIQVVDADWQGWKRSFHDDPKAEMKLYDTLNHLGIAGEGDGSLAEYAQPGHVDSQLIADIATWVKAQR